MHSGRRLYQKQGDYFFAEITVDELNGKKYFYKTRTIFNKNVHT